MWFLTNIWPAILAAACGAIGWIAIQFVGKPVRQFYDLRTEASKLIALHGYDMFGLFSETAKNDYKQIGAKLVAFDTSEPLAPPIIRRLGYDPKLAGRALLTVSSNWGNIIKGDAVQRGIEGIKLALKLP
ncbi:MAG: hypothetical protein WAN65_29620, partial [Candidatus Sulfotelmatobacter sp.]